MVTEEEIKEINNWIESSWGIHVRKFNDLHKNSTQLSLNLGSCKSFNSKIQLLDHLEELNCEFSQIEVFNFQHETIKRINLVENKINRINLNCPNLEYLNVSYNKLEMIDNIYAPNLKEFHCDENLLFKDKKLYELAKKFGYNPQFIQESGLQESLFLMFCHSTQLIINGNSFRVLEKHNQKNIKNIEKLSISYSPITSFILKSKKIKFLFLRCNQLNSIELHCPNLEVLDISLNNLKFIEKIYAPKLEMFFCDDNLMFKEENNLYKLALNENRNPQLIQESNLKKDLF